MLDSDAFVFRLGDAPAAFAMSRTGDGCLCRVKTGMSRSRTRSRTSTAEDRVPACAALMTGSLFAFGGSRHSTAVAFTVREDFSRGNLYGIPLLPDPTSDDTMDTWSPSAHAADTTFLVTAVEAVCFVDAVGATLERHAMFKGKRL